MRYAPPIPAAPRNSMFLGAVPLLLALAGCTTFSADAGMGLVNSRVTADIQKTTAKIGTEAQEASVRSRVDALLKSALSAETAVQIALLNNRGLQAEYNALGISEADYVEASLPENPVVSLGKMITGAEIEIEARLVGSILSLFTLKSRSAIAELEFEAAQYRAIEATFRLAADTRRAFYRAVAARQIVSFLEQARDSAAAAAELTIKLGETGAASKIEQARASAFHLEVSNQLAEARIEAGVGRESLVRMLGLWGSDVDFRLPGVLPQIPDAIPKSQDIEAVAIRKRVDLAIARLELDALARSLGLSKATRFTSMLDLAGLASYSRSQEGGETEESRTYGLEIEFEVPLFDLGGVNVRRASETYMQAVNRMAELAIIIRSDVRAAYLTYRGTYDISWQYRNKILPMRQIISEQALLESNGMIIDVFDLLTAATESVDSNIEAITAKRDFFLASVDFQTALIGGSASSSREE